MRRGLLPEGESKSIAAVGNCLRAKGITAGGEEQVSNGSNGMLESGKDYLLGRRILAGGVVLAVVQRWEFTL